MSDEPPAWIVFCEARADHELATALADRAIEEKLPWSVDCLGYMRRWRGFEPTAPHTTWKAVKHLAAERGLKVHRKLGSGHLGSADVEARKAVALVHQYFDGGVTAVVLMRDTDGEADRITGFSKAREGVKPRFAIVLALPHPEREAWVLAGFEPENKDEQTRLAKERQLLGFDPRERAAELNPKATANADGEPIKRSTKRILDALTAGDFGRERRCWTDTGLEVLRRRGQQSGLVRYLDEVTQRLAPLVGTTVAG